MKQLPDTTQPGLQGLKATSEESEWNQRFYLLNGPAPKGKVKRHLYNLLKAWPAEEQQTDPSLPTDESHSWPHSSGIGSAAEINHQIGPPEQSRRELVARLDDFDYPYPEGNKKHKTFYDHLESRGLLPSIIEPPFLWTVRMVWWWRKALDVEGELKERGLSERRIPLKFHRVMMNLVCEHHSKVEKLCKSYGVLGQPWIGEYLAALNRRFLGEAKFVYPEAYRRLTPSSQLHSYHPGSTSQLEIYRAIMDLQARCGKKRNNKLAHQLTALICSSPESIKKQKLEPNPEAVRRSIGSSNNRR